MWIDAVVTEGFIMLVCAALPVALIGAIARAASPRENLLPLFVMMTGVAVLGSVSGWNGGQSRDGVVGDIIPAALGLLGAVAVYLFGTKPKSGLVASFCAAAFALALGAGYSAGAAKRGPLDAETRGLALCTSVFTDPKVLGTDDAFFRAVSLFGKTCAELLGQDFQNTQTQTKRHEVVQNIDIDRIISGLCEVDSAFREKHCPGS